MLTAVQSAPDPVVVQGVGQGYVDGVDVRAVQEFLVSDVEGASPLGGGLPRTRGVPARDSGEPRTGASVEGGHHPAAGEGGRPEDADGQRSYCGGVGGHVSTFCRQVMRVRASTLT
ncbi:hypothetical protein SHKM778_32070 [Streptomyces sp. KM77-8]|uniref:Uncharacterized protein n=1 Tax=Streptomyces haneummycinicus TaxID=3074435 RepID=A0AAT9HHD5_9ACTN